MGSWRLKRQVDCGDEVVYKFTPKFVLKAGHSVTVRAITLEECLPAWPECDAAVLFFFVFL